MSRWAAAAVVAIDVLAAIVGTLAPAAFAPGAPAQLVPPGNFAFPALFLAVGLTGAVVIWYRPDHVVGWILAVSSVVGALEHLLAGWAAISIYGGILPGGIAAAWVFSWLEIFHLMPLVTLVLLLFPDGRLPSSRWAAVAWVAVLDTVALALVLMVLPADVPVFGIPNPLGVSALGSVLLPLAAALFALNAVCVIASAASLALRYRRASPADRARIRWVALAALVVLPVTVGTLLLSLPLERAALVATIAYLPIPVSMAIAIVRYRLFDIDVLLRRTLVYGSLTVAIASSYAATVILFQAVLRPLIGGSEIAVAASTLAALAVVQPLRRRIQEGVDRRFYRSRYHAELTLDGFAARMRDVVDLDTLRSDLVDVVGEALRPAHAGVWLRGGGPDR